MTHNGWAIWPKRSCDQPSGVEHGPLVTVECTDFCLSDWLLLICCQQRPKTLYIGLKMFSYFKVQFNRCPVRPTLTPMGALETLFILTIQLSFTEVDTEQWVNDSPCGQRWLASYPTSHKRKKKVFCKCQTVPFQPTFREFLDIFYLKKKNTSKVLEKLCFVSASLSGTGVPLAAASALPSPCLNQSLGISWQAGDDPQRCFSVGFYEAQMVH